MIKRTKIEIINLLINKFNYKTYLEIGCDKNKNFNRINIEHKIGVDPKRGGTIKMTSDNFFKQNKEKFDIIFIDGLHHSDQVYKDILNSVFFLNINGTIIVHDCNPINYFTQLIPRPRMPRSWNGDVWRGFLKLKSEKEDLEMFVIDIDHGCGIVRRGKQNLITKWDMEYQEFEKNKKELLNLISVDDFINYLNEK